MRRVAIIGGGLSGLTTAIRLVRANIPVVVFEKNSYPFHRVCGEYISNETLPFLKSQRLFPDDLLPASIKRLQLSSVNGKSAFLPLDLGGFGISRYAYDHWLYKRAVEEGVVFHLNTTVEQLNFKEDHFEIKTQQSSYESTVVIGSYGKRSKLDVQQDRSFIKKRSPYLGIKYHIRTQHPADLIALHNFKDGYCGISNVEDGKTNLCYLSHRDNLKKYKNIPDMQEAVLFRNPFLKDIFKNSEFLFQQPETINEISFETKSPVENHILMTGDSAGMITPLCGNGMAMAIHSAKLVSERVIEFFSDKISREYMEQTYSTEWKRCFESRLWAGRKIQNLFGSEWASNFAVNLALRAKPIADYLISKTHGEPF